MTELIAVCCCLTHIMMLISVMTAVALGTSLQVIRLFELNSVIQHWCKVSKYDFCLANWKLSISS